VLVKIEARILIFPGMDFHFPSTSVPPGTFLGSACRSNIGGGVATPATPAALTSMDTCTDVEDAFPGAAARHGASNVRELITWEITRVLVCNPVITTGLVIWTDHDARDVFY